MKKSTVFFMATTAFLAGLLAGSACAKAKKSAMKIGDNNFFGFKISIENNGKESKCRKEKSFCCKKKEKLPETIENEESSEEVKETEDGLDGNNC